MFRTDWGFTLSSRRFGFAISVTTLIGAVALLIGCTSTIGGTAVENKNDAREISEAAASSSAAATTSKRREAASKLCVVFVVENKNFVTTFNAENTTRDEVLTAADATATAIRKELTPDVPAELRSTIENYLTNLEALATGIRDRTAGEQHVDDFNASRKAASDACVAEVNR